MHQSGKESRRSSLGTYKGTFAREVLGEGLRWKPTNWLKSKLAPEWRWWLLIADGQFHCDRGKGWQQKSPEGAHL